jgi:hypothetical protein
MNHQLDFWSHHSEWPSLISEIKAIAGCSLAHIEQGESGTMRPVPDDYFQSKARSFASLYLLPLNRKVRLELITYPAKVVLDTYKSEPLLLLSLNKGIGSTICLCMLHLSRPLSGDAEEVTSVEMYRSAARIIRSRSVKLYYCPPLSAFVRKRKPSLTVTKRTKDMVFGSGWQLKVGWGPPLSREHVALTADDLNCEDDR